MDGNSTLFEPSSSSSMLLSPQPLSLSDHCQLDPREVASMPVVDKCATLLDVNFAQDPVPTTPLRRNLPPLSDPVLVMGSPSVEITPRTKRSYAMLEADSRKVQLGMLEQEREDKTTKRIYKRCLKSYSEWWNQNQVRVVADDPQRVAIPALPITVAKVVMFLEHEMTREKKKVCVAYFLLVLSFVLTVVPLSPFLKHTRAGGETTIAGSSVGASHIKVVISALESERLHNEHSYKHVPESQINLRSDHRIRSLESAAKHNEPQRADKAHLLKAAGSSAGVY
jgi:hypothetical protein